MGQKLKTKEQKEVREIIIQRLKNDLIGPKDIQEIIKPTESNYLESPRNIYLSGAIYPMNTEPGNDEAQEIIEEVGADSIGSANATPYIDSKLPSTIGLSFFINTRHQSPLKINAFIDGGIYKYMKTKKPEEQKFWKRKPIEGLKKSIEIDWITHPDGVLDSIKLDDLGISGFEIYARWTTVNNIGSSETGCLLKITLVLINRNTFDSDKEEFHAFTEKTLFQSKLRIIPISPATLEPNPNDFRVLNNEQRELNSLLYRNTREYAKGHTCSADWTLDGEVCIQIETEWIPEEIIYDTNIDGNKEIIKTLKELDVETFNAKILSDLDENKMEKVLSVIPETYEKWLQEQDTSIELFNSEKYQRIAKKQIKSSRKAIDRMKKSIKLIISDEKIFKAFKLANEAINLQYSWQKNNKSLDWRPFQLSFILLSIESVLIDESDDRDLMDLLWFPTGGGKTEAYLFLIAVLLFYRRLEKGGLDKDDGVCVITRYTLRALTSDQFKRTSGLICACEYIRRKEIEVQQSTPFSIGLWIGEGATPNKLYGSKDAAIYGKKNKILNTNVKQLSECPCCHEKIQWNFEEDNLVDPIYCKCINEECKLSKSLEKLPIHTVDDQIYNVSPSVLIGTVDKFVNITGKPSKTKALFNHGTKNKPPSLIIQDELHLISGPLGSLTGIFETTIDVRCSRMNKEGEIIKPKIIGSTATIQQAKEQIKSLYNRSSITFPIPISEAGDTFFSEVNKESSGRKYLGLSSAGRTSTYMYSVSAGSLMQSKHDLRFNNLSDDAVDPYTTLAIYFNSLRELGGARTHLQEDAIKARNVFAKKYNEKQQNIELTELTSNVSQDELRTNLENLTKNILEDGHIDVLLASSMISVGIDIPRLGLMMVNGQPKTMSEYIQATSRVGRGEVPGLILTVYNSFKIRDRSFFESFKSWHSSFYRHVEATSVTPFSARSRDKVLPSLIVSLAYQFIEELTESDVELTPERRQVIETKIFPIILERVKDIDPDEYNSTEKEIIEFLDKWQNRGKLQYLWNDWKGMEKTLLISSNRSSIIRAQGYDGELAATSAPTSARDVEPSVQIKLQDEII